MNDDRHKELEQLAERLIWHVETMQHWTGVAADQMVKEARAALTMTETERTPGNWEVELRGDQVYVEGLAPSALKDAGWGGLLT